MDTRRLIHTGLAAAAVLMASACGPSSMSSLPGGLTIEEHRLTGAPTTDPLAFNPVEGSMDGVLALHAAERSRIIPEDSELIEGRHAIRLTLGSDVLIATENYSGSGNRSWVTVTRNDREIYRIGTGMPGPVPGLQGLWAYDNHWAVETVYGTPDSFLGIVSVDGSQFRPRGNVGEAFDFQLLHGKPFHFVTELGHTGFRYDGRSVEAGYDEIPHYQCCSASVLNPVHAQNMIAFFARRGDAWFYVEIGVFDD